MSQEKLSPFFCIVVFRRERYDTKEAVRRDVEHHVLLHVRANGDASMTHKRWEHGQSGHESRDYTLNVVPYVGGWLALSIVNEPIGSTGWGRGRCARWCKWTRSMLSFRLARTEQLRFLWCQETCGLRRNSTPKMWRIGDAEEISKVVRSVWAAALLRNVSFLILFRRKGSWRMVSRADL